MKVYLMILLSILVVIQSINLPDKVGYDTLNIGSSINVNNKTLVVNVKSYLSDNELLSIANSYKSNIQYVYSLYYKLLNNRISEDQFINELNVMDYDVKAYYSLSPSNIVKVYLVRKGDFSVVLSPSQTFGLSSNYTRLQRFGSQINWDNNEIMPNVNVVVIETPSVKYVDMIKYGEGNVIVTIDTTNKVITRIFSSDEDFIVLDKNTKINRIVVWGLYGGYREVKFKVRKTLYSIENLGVTNYDIQPSDSLTLVTQSSAPIKITYYESGVEKQVNSLKCNIIDNNKKICTLNNDVTMFKNILRNRVIRVYYYNQLIGLIRFDSLIKVDVENGKLKFSSSFGDVLTIVDIYLNNKKINSNIIDISDGYYRVSMKADSTIYDEFYAHYPRLKYVNVVYNDKDKKYTITTSNDPIIVYLLEPHTMKVKKVLTINPYMSVNISADYAIVVNGEYYYHPVPTMWGKIWILELIVIIVVGIAITRYLIQYLYNKGKIDFSSFSDLISKIKNRNRKEENEVEREYSNSLFNTHYLAMSNVVKENNIDLSPEDFDLEVLVMNKHKDESYSVWIDKYGEYGVVIVYRHGKGESIKVEGKTIIPAYNAHKVAILLRSVPHKKIIEQYISPKEKLQKGPKGPSINNKQNKKDVFKKTVANLPIDGGIKIG